jgi:hypothetical protein
MKNNHEENKFLWFVSAVALFDVAVLLNSQNWAATIIIGLIEMIHCSDG